MAVKAKHAAAAEILPELLEALGESAVASDHATLARYARSTSGTPTPPLAVVYPATTAEVQQVVRWATRHDVALHPISGGRNWGYGDACPPTVGQVVVDLSRMTRIVEVNVDSAYAVIQPGVTQGQLYQYLQDRDLPLWMDATGAGHDASLIGNSLDRGFGHTRLGDHALSTCGMKVVLSDGHVLDTGFTHYPRARAARVYRYGLGPFVDGLFGQSNFGIVTELGLWLMPRPEAFRAFFIAADEAQDLGPLVDRLSSLRKQGVLQSTIHIGNDLRVISARRRYPWELTGGQTPLPTDIRDRLRRECGIGAWGVAGALYGPARVVCTSAGELRRRMRPYRVRFLDDRKLARAEAIGRALSVVGRGRRLRSRLAAVKPTYGLLKGRPTDEPLRGAAWRVRGPIPEQPADPRDLHAGLMWVTPVLPARGDDAMQVVEVMERIYADHGFEPLITFTMINERAMTCVSNLAFDTREAAEVRQAAACHDQLLEVLMRQGFVPYRAGLRGQRFAALKSTGAFAQFAADLKHAIDPRGAISPGRYVLTHLRAGNPASK